MTENTTHLQEQRNRQGLFVLVALSTCLFVGAALGWGPMQLMLEDSGAYSHECQSQADTPSTDVCPDQTAKLVKIGLLVPTAQILSPVLGLFVDKYGPQRSALAQAGALLLGLGLVLVSVTQSGMDWLLYVGFGFVAVHTWFGRLLIVQLGLYFVGHNMSRTIFVLNSLFDAGAVTFLVLWGIQQVSGASLEAILGGYLALAVCIAVGAIYFWTVAKPQNREVAVESLETFMDRSHRGSSAFALDFSRHSAASVTPEPTLSKKATTEGSKTDPNNQSRSTPTGYTLVAQRTRKEQLMSTPFLLLCATFALHVGMNNWNIMTQRDFLAGLGDDEHNHLYLTIFVLMTPVSILGTPLIDWIILKFGWNAAFQTINVLGFGYTLIKVASTNLNVQVLAFCLFSFYRSFLFGISFSFLPTLIAGKHVGFAAGTMAGMAGLTNLFLIPLVDVAVKRSDGNFLLPNSIMLGMTVPAVTLVCMLGKQMVLEQAEKERIDTANEVEDDLLKKENMLETAESASVYSISDEVSV